MQAIKVRRVHFLYVLKGLKAPYVIHIINLTMLKIPNDR